MFSVLARGLLEEEIQQIVAAIKPVPIVRLIKQFNSMHEPYPCKPELHP